MDVPPGLGRRPHLVRQLRLVHDPGARGVPLEHALRVHVDELHPLGRRRDPDRPAARRLWQVCLRRHALFLLRLRLQPGPAGSGRGRHPRAVGALEVDPEPRGHARPHPDSRLVRQDALPAERADRDERELRRSARGVVLPLAALPAAGRRPGQPVGAGDEAGRADVPAPQAGLRVPELHHLPTGRRGRPGGAAEGERAVRQVHPPHERQPGWLRRSNHADIVGLGCLAGGVSDGGQRLRGDAEPPEPHGHAGHLPGRPGHHRAPRGEPHAHPPRPGAVGGFRVHGARDLQPWQRAVHSACAQGIRGRPVRDRVPPFPARHPVRGHDQDEGGDGGRAQPDTERGPPARSRGEPGDGRHRPPAGRGPRPVGQGHGAGAARGAGRLQLRRPRDGRRAAEARPVRRGAQDRHRAGLPLGLPGLPRRSGLLPRRRQHGTHAVGAVAGGPYGGPPATLCHRRGG
mmetsp:Transcript_4657/g.13094  ORF Transcript_4657/g.13094 Transcript_4657/m.13094 type:complete len:459 (-) Transcript_4657:865-2241(-)